MDATRALAAELGVSGAAAPAVPDAAVILLTAHGSIETAVFARKGESLTRKSAEELARKAKALKSAFGGEDETFVLNLVKAELDGYGTAVPVLNEILDRTLSAVKR